MEQAPEASLASSEEEPWPALTERLPEAVEILNGVR